MTASQALMISLSNPGASRMEATADGVVQWQGAACTAASRPVEFGRSTPNHRSGQQRVGDFQHQTGRRVAGAGLITGACCIQQRRRAHQANPINPRNSLCRMSKICGPSRQRSPKRLSGRRWLPGRDDVQYDNRLGYRCEAASSLGRCPRCAEAIFSRLVASVASSRLSRRGRDAQRLRRQGTIPPHALADWHCR